MAFDDFTSNTTPVSSGASIFSYYRPASPPDDSKPLIILLHGYPQNNSMWKEFVTLLPKQWSLFVPDLPGYGNSEKSTSDDSSLPFSKRAMAKDILEAADHVHRPDAKVIAYGHDRGGRVSYRMALDHPDRVVGLAVLDIVPTIYMWNSMRPDNDHKETKASNHWIFLSAPKPIPETLIGGNPVWYFNYTMSAWSQKAKQQQPPWIEDSWKPFADPDKKKVTARISAACEDYRAGASFDVDHDREQGIDPAKAAQIVFHIPVLALASIHLRKRHDVDGIWGKLVEGKHLQSHQLGGDTTGHFFVNEETTETAEKTISWLNEYWP